MIKQEYNFQYPIDFLEDKQELKKNVIEDLELLKFNDENENSQGIMEYVIEPKTIFGKHCLPDLTKHTTTNVKYLKDTQSIIKKYPKISQDPELHDKISSFWFSLKQDDNFVNNYKYIDIKYFNKLNESSIFLQILSLYNMSSPIMFFIVPFIMLLVPFFILKFKKLDVSMNSYMSLLKKVLKNHALGILVNTNYKEINWGTTLYLLFTIGFYLFQMYQNVLSCINYYKNMSKIHDYIFSVKDFLIETRENIELIEMLYNKHPTYVNFTTMLVHYKVDINKYINELNDITPFSINISKIGHLGYIMKHFYKFHKDEKVHQYMDFAFHLNGYMDYMCRIKELVDSKKLNACTFGKKTKMKGSYYAKLIKDKYVDNNIDLSKNIIITGPNAAGKTTLIKTAAINIIFSQQVGFGFYKRATFNPYNHIHSYLNIPDTSGRDSLFQAEARRCKEIIDDFEINKKDRHFCIFDELYSGTNPYEAVGSAYGFLKYINNNKKINFIITTHYGQLCKLLDSEQDIVNKHMKIEMKDDNYSFNYTYKLDSGISQVKGGFKVLKELNYPSDLLNSVLEISNKLI